MLEVEMGFLVEDGEVDGDGDLAEYTLGDTSSQQQPGMDIYGVHASGPRALRSDQAASRPS